MDYVPNAIKILKLMYVELSNAIKLRKSDINFFLK